MRTEKGITFDRESARSVDEQGFMHVSGCNISRAVVNKYFGYEIPGWEQHGLIRNKVYSILRPAEELAAAAPTFNNLPLVDGHISVDAWDLEDPKVKERIVGSTGTDTVFEAPFLKNTLVVWTSGAQKNIENRSKMELSCGYRYTFVPETGVYAGERYDGRMTNIIGNHVALVEVGRAGRDVAVADSDPFHTEVSLKKSNITPAGLVVVGAVHSWLSTNLAQDAAVSGTEVLDVVSGTEPMAFDEQVPHIVKNIGDAFKDRLAQDTDLDGLCTILDTIGASLTDYTLDADDGGKDGGDVAEDGKACDACKGKLTKDGKCKTCEDKKAQANDNNTVVDDHTHKEGTMSANQHENPEKPVVMDQAAVDNAVKLALDAALPAITTTVQTNIAARYAAAKAVEPHVGVVDPMALDSADAIYKLALDHAKVNTEGVEPSAFRHMVSMLPTEKPTAPRPAPVAADADAIRSFHEAFPGAKDMLRA